jgi:PAS domain S-box-containing protein
LTLRWRTYLLVGATLLATMIVVYYASQTLFMRGFANVETAQMQDQIKRAELAISQNLAELDADVFNYASWDDTVAFIGTGDQAYVDNNLPASFYTGFKANLAVFVRPDGSVVYGKGYDLEQNQLTSMPAGLSEYLTRESPLVRHATVDSKISGILSLPDGPMLVSSYPILTSNSEGPVKGAVILGRWLDADRVAGLSSQTLLPLSLLALDAPGLPTAVTDAVRSDAPSERTIVVRPDDRLLDGYAVLDDLFGRPVRVLQVTAPRDVYREGSASARYFFAALVGILVLVALATVLVLEQSVLRRLARLTAAVRSFRSGEGNLNPIVADGKDEISELARTIDSGFLELDTARRKIEHQHQELVRSEEHFRALIENSSDLIAVVDAAGVLQFQSPSVERVLGYRPEDLTGKNCFDFVHPDDVAQSAESLVELLRGEWEQSNTLEARFRHVDGSWRTLEIMGKRLDGPPGEALYVLNSRDITGRKEAEEALRQTEGQLRQAQKMEAVGQLAGGIAHDFNNLLTAIVGYSDLVLASGASSLDEVRSDIEEIRDTGNRAGDLTKQILAFSRRQILRPQALSLSEVVDSMRSLLARTLGEDVALEVRNDPQLDFTEIDRHQIEQVLMNLAVNARDAMRAGGLLTIETANVELDERYCRAHPEVAPGRYVSVSVSDTGTGMDAETMSRVFEPFFTTKSVGEGTGLGLAVVDGIVRQSRGSISVFSKPGKGTTFKIYFLSSGQRGVVEDDVITAQVAERGAETIMVVEDETNLRRLIERILSGAGYTTLVLASPEEALEMLQRGEPPIDMLLTDVVLPGPLQGHDLAQAASAVQPGLRILFMSGHTGDALVHSGRLVSGVSLLEKPFTPDALALAVRAVLDGGHPLPIGG